MWNMAPVKQLIFAHLVWQNLKDSICDNLIINLNLTLTKEKGVATLMLFPAILKCFILP